MNREAARKIADAILYEGYMLYPYRPSAIKNRQRWSFGILYPPGFIEVENGTERSSMHSECLLEIKGDARLQIQLRFLQLMRQNAISSPERSLAPTGSKMATDISESADKAIERSAEFELPSLGGEHRFAFEFPETHSEEPIGIGATAFESDTGHKRQHLRGTLSVSTYTISDGILKLTVEANNVTWLASDSADRHSALFRSLLSAHMIWSVTGGEFVSLLEPPKNLQEAARTCRNVGNFPVLLGSDGDRDMLLCSPILLYDYPQVAPESAGDFYDATEMDEMLTLRILTLTDEEKDEVRVGDEHIRNLLECTERAANHQLARTHGAIRSLRSVSK